MTKARTKSQKLANRRRASSFGDLAPVPRRAKQGKARMKEIAVEHDADIPALVARCRQLGIAADEAGLRYAKALFLGCNAGRAMAEVVTDEEERTDLWAAITHMRRVQVAYDFALGAPSRHAVCLRMLLPLEALHADAETPPADMRTDDERHRQAVTAWMQVQGWLGHADKRGASICKGVVLDDERCPDPASMVAALRCVADGVAGRKIMYRAA